MDLSPLGVNSTVEYFNDAIPNQSKIIKLVVLCFLYCMRGFFAIDW